MNDLFTKEFDSESNDDEYVPTQKEIEKADKDWKNQKASSVNLPSNPEAKAKVDLFWEKMKTSSSQPPQKPITTPALEKPKTESTPSLDKETSATQESLDEQIKAALKKSKEQKKKIVSDTYYYAGQKFESVKEIDEKEAEKMKNKQTHKGLDSWIDQITNKKNISTMDKSKKDWKNYVEENKIEKELIINRKDGYLGKKQFIDDANAYIQEHNKLSIKKAKYAYETKVNPK